MVRSICWGTCQVTFCFGAHGLTAWCSFVSAAGRSCKGLWLLLMGECLAAMRVEKHHADTVAEEAELR